MPGSFGVGSVAGDVGAGAVGAPLASVGALAGTLVSVVGEAWAFGSAAGGGEAAAAGGAWPGSACAGAGWLL